MGFVGFFLSFSLLKCKVNWRAVGDGGERVNLRIKKLKIIEDGVWGWGWMTGQGETALRTLAAGTVIWWKRQVTGPLVGKGPPRNLLLPQIWAGQPAPSPAEQSCRLGVGEGIGRNLPSGTCGWLWERLYPNQYPTAHLCWFILFFRKASWGTWWVSFSFLHGRLFSWASSGFCTYAPVLVFLLGKEEVANTEHFSEMFLSFALDVFLSYSL